MPRFQELLTAAEIAALEAAFDWHPSVRNDKSETIFAVGPKYFDEPTEPEEHFRFWAEMMEKNLGPVYAPQ